VIGKNAELEAPSSMQGYRGSVENVTLETSQSKNLPEFGNGYVSDI
jgi:hypothetical protein